MSECGGILFFQKHDIGFLGCLIFLDLDWRLSDYISILCLLCEYIIPYLSVVAGTCS